MADKWQAIDAFFNSFQLPAYDERSVPDNASMPYITYNAPVANFEQPTVFQSSIWYRSSSWREISQKAHEIATRLRGYALIPIDGGYMFLTEGAPFAQRMASESDTVVKRMYILINVEFFTEV